MTTTFAKLSSRGKSYTAFATPLVLDPPRHCGLPTIQLGQGRHLLGTADDCTIRVMTDDVQPHHALVTVSQHRTVVKALDPRTWVNEGPVTEMALRPGDRLSLGPITFRVRAATPDELASFLPWTEEPPTATTPLEWLLSERPAIEEPKLIPQETISPRLGLTTPILRDRQPDPVVDTAWLEPLVPQQKPIPAINNAVENPPARTTVAADAPVPQTPPITAVTPIELAPPPVDEPHPHQSSTDTLGQRLDEIQQRLDELQKPVAVTSASAPETLLRGEALSAERRQLELRHEELQRRADELARQTQQLQERAASVAEREEEIERRQARLAVENEQLVASAEATRRKVDEEYARHQTLWQEWDAACLRTSEELKGQLQAMEQRRTALLAEADRLSIERSDLQRLQSEHESDRRAIAAERVQLTSDHAAFQSQRAHFDTERQQHLVAMQQREAQLASERRALANAQEELHSTRQQWECERTSFLAERTAEAARREAELREHARLREQLDEDLLNLERDRSELMAIRHELEDERTAFGLERAEATKARQELANLWDRLQQTESELNCLKQSPAGTHFRAAGISFDNDPQESPSLDWFAEPYKSLDTRAEPMSVPPRQTFRDMAGHSPEWQERPAFQFQPVPVPVLPSSLTTVADPAPNFLAASRDPVAERPSSDLPALNVMLPPQSPNRFWEDHNESHFASTEHSRTESPADPRAIKVPQNSSSLDNTMTAPVSTVAEVDESVPTEENLGEGVVRSWSRSLSEDLPYVAGELEETTSTATAVLDAEPSVEETLADVNRRFGVPVSSFVDEKPTHEPRELPSWWKAAATESHAVAERSESEAAHTAPLLKTEPPAVTTAHTEEPTAESNDPAPVDNLSLSYLRLQLAQMFDLPKDAEAKVRHPEPETFDTPLEAEPLSETSDEEGLPQDDQSVLNNVIDHTADSSAETDAEALAVDSTHHSEPQPELTATVATAEAASQASPDKSAETSAEEEGDSVASFMAQLLARSRGGAEVSAREVKALTESSKAGRQTPEKGSGRADDMSPLAVTIDPNDRSHLEAEPKHKQDRQAVRDHLKSFREVAHQSARSALARHTSKHLKAAVIAKSVLFGVSVLAAATFLGGPLLGMRSQVWKGLACSLATLLSGIELFRSWSQLRQWKATGQLTKSHSDLPTVSAGETIEPAPATAIAASAAE